MIIKKAVILSLVFLLPAALFAQRYKKHVLNAGKLSIDITEGMLNLIPLTEKVIRVQWEKAGIKESQELVLVNKQAVPKFSFSETPSQLKISTSAVTVLFTKKTATLDFLDKAGKVFLSEKAGGRKLTSSTVGENLVL